MATKEYDYIVVGGGTAGLVVASRLSENPDVQVLVIEAGGDKTKDPLVMVPGLVAGVYGKDEYDWDFKSTPQASLHDRFISQPRGRMLGGSSALNFMMTVYPGRAVLDAWAALGNDGWGYDDLAPYFRKFAKTAHPPASAMEISRLAEHYDTSISDAESGPLAITYSDSYGTMNSAWMESFAKLGLRATADPRSGTTFGAFQQSATIDPETKTRTFSASAYLPDAVRARPNLTVLTDTVVKKLTLGGQGDAVEATGVHLADGSEIQAKREVVLAAGALQTPQLLELSGVGDPELLKKHGIPVVVANANVGENMQDHPIVCQTFEVNDGIATSDILRDPAVLNAVVAMFQDGGKGPLGQSIISSAYAPLVGDKGVLDVADRKTILDASLKLPAATSSDALAAKAAGLIRGILESKAEPGVQYLAFPGQTTIKQIGSMAEILLPSRPQNCITVMTILNHPFSRGACHIVSPDVGVKPAWDPRYNDVPADLEILAGGVRFVETLVHTEPLAGIFRKDGLRWPETAATDADSAREIVRKAQISVFHVSGSCAMAPKEQGGVVDAKLKVYGVGKLRVVDASVFPIEPLGNVQTTVYAVAEKAADLIKADQ